MADDDQSTRESLAVLLEFHGHHVTTAESGREALRALDEGEWDVIVLDILMPDMDGIEVLSALSKYGERQAPRVLAISGGGTHQHRLELLDLATRCGAHATMKKPFEPRAVMQVVDRLAGTP